MRGAHTRTRPPPDFPISSLAAGCAARCAERDPHRHLSSQVDPGPASADADAPECARPPRTVDRKQFRGFARAVHVYPELIGSEDTDLVFDRVRRLLLLEALAGHTFAESLERLGADVHAAEQGFGGAAHRSIGATQFVAACVRFAAKICPDGTELHAALDQFMDRRLMRLHRTICGVSAYDAFLRSRSATAVFAASRQGLLRVFALFSKPASSGGDHCMDLGNWLSLLEHASLLDSAPGATPVNRLTKTDAVRLFVEVNLDDLQLDLVKVGQQEVNRSNGRLQRRSRAPPPACPLPTLPAAHIARRHALLAPLCQR